MFDLFFLFMLSIIMRIMNAIGWAILLFGFEQLMLEDLE